MRLVFFPVDCCPFHGKSLEERPLGGTETSVIRLTEELAKLGHETYVTTAFSSPPETEARYITPQKANHLGEIDVLVVVRGLKGLFLPFESKKRLFWTGDAWHNSNTMGIGDRRYVSKIDAFLAVSDWHAHTLCNASGFPLGKTFVLRNGIHLANFAGTEQRHRKRLIYSSTPSRGLVFLPEIFRRLKEKHKELELHIFSSNAIYQKLWTGVDIDDEKYEALYEKLRDMPGCFVHGSILQKDLSREFMKSTILAYPTDFEETSCITAMEAQAAGCVIVSSYLAALPETVGEAGVLIGGQPGSGSYADEFVGIVDKVLADDSLFQYFSYRGLEQAKKFDWSFRAKELIAFLHEKLGIA